MATRFNVEIVSTGDIAQPVISGDRQGSMIRLGKLLAKLASGNQKGTAVNVRNTGVRASGTVTCADVQADDTVTLGGIVLTAKASGATGNQWNVGEDDAECATNLAALINASTTAGIAGCYTATAADDVVTITAIQPGKLGNAVTLASSDAGNLAVSGARLSGGSESLVTLSF